MDLFLALTFVLLAGLLFFAMRQTKLSGDAGDFPYQKCAALFSPAERSFLGVLEQAVGSEYRVFGKVRVADVAQVKRLPNRSAWQRAFNRISAKHFDFVICNADNLSVVGAVELDDASHQTTQRQNRDRLVAEVCRAIALPLLQIPARQAYCVRELREKFQQAIATPQTKIEK